MGRRARVVFRRWETVTRNETAPAPWDNAPDSWADEAQAGPLTSYEGIDELAASAELEAKPTLDLARLSFSQLGTYRKCGEAYRLGKIENVPRTPAAWLAGGTAFHAGMESWELTGRPTDTAPAIDLAVASFDAEIEKMKAVEPDLEKWLTGGRTKPAIDLKRRRERVPEQVAKYVVFATSQPWRIWETPFGPAVELGFEIEFSGCIVRGYVDQIIRWPDGTLEIVDAKTGAKRPESADQLGIYALGLEIEYGDIFRPALGHFYMAKDGTTTAPVDLTGYTFSKIERWFNDFARAREAGIFIPYPSEDHCRPCDVRRFCSAVDGEDSGLYHPDPTVRGLALEQAALEAMYAEAHPELQETA